LSCLGAIKGASWARWDGAESRKCAPPLVYRIAGLIEASDMLNGAERIPMGVIEDVRKVIQDLVAPELKSISVRLDSLEKEARVRDELTHVKIEALSAKMDAQYQSLLYNLNLDKRIETLERDRQSASA
jgi:hypothetical protein